MTSLLSPAETPPSVVAVAGNPRTGSRTLRVAATVAERVAEAVGAAEPVTSLDLADIAGQLLVAPSPDADAYRSVLAGATVAVVATPVYKASYTGLLKAFLDGYGAGGLRGVIAVPVVVSASPAHAFVAEHLLRPLLVELGATVSVRPIAVVEAQLGDLDAVIGPWADEAGPVLAALVEAARVRAGVGAAGVGAAGTRTFPPEQSTAGSPVAATRTTGASR